MADELVAPELAAALVEALADLTVIEKAHTADAGSYSYSYADITDVVKLTRPVLAKHGIIALTSVHAHGDSLACTVKLLHTSGGFLDMGPFPFPHGKDAQATGSMVTYHRRYALVAALGMAAGDDDDGAAAEPRQEQAAVEPPVPGFRTSLIGARDKLSDAERELLREWLKEAGLPRSPANMDAEQSDRVLEYILHGLPKVPDEPLEEVPA